MKPVEKISYLALNTLSNLLGHISQSGRQKCGDFLASIGYRIITTRKNEALSNIKRAFPEKSDNWHTQVLKEAYRFFSNMFTVFMSYPTVFRFITFTVSNKSILNEALKLNKGVIFITGHFGSWELLAAWMGKAGYPFYGVAQRQRNLGANRFFEEQRSSNHVSHLYRKDSLDTMYSLLEQNHVLALVSDQDAKQNGVFVDFFNTPSSTTKGAAKFHINTGAPMIFASCIKTSFNNFHVSFEKIPNGTDLKMITQSFTKILENKIREYPEQYFWFHRRWKTKINHGIN